MVASKRCWSEQAAVRESRHVRGGLWLVRWKPSLKVEVWNRLSDCVSK